MASIRYRESRKTWQAQIRLEGIPPESKTFGTKREAQAWAKARERELSTKPRLSADDTTLGDLAQRYLETPTVRKYKSFHSYHGLYLTRIQRHAIAKKRLSELTLGDFGRYRDERLEKVTANTIYKEFTIYQRVLKVAAKEWRVPVPFTEINKGLEFKAKPKEIVRRIEDHERDVILKTIAERKTLRPEVRKLLGDAFLLCLETGLRRGEMLKLRPRHYSSRYQTLEVVDTKNDEDRIIALSPLAERIIVSRLHLDPLFDLHFEAFKTYWQRILKKAGIEELRFHDTRHEALSSYFEKGLSLPEVQNQSGHKTLSALNRYVHAKVQNIVNKLAENENGCKERKTPRAGA